VIALERPTNTPLFLSGLGGFDPATGAFIGAGADDRWRVARSGHAR
jgi:hypothetical protein